MTQYDDGLIVGVDPSSQSLAAVIVADDQDFVAYKRSVRRKGPAWNPQEAHAVMKNVEDFFLFLLDIRSPDHVFLEAPVMGRSVRPTIVQSYVSGMIQAVVAGTGATLVLVNNKAWKKAIVGNGNAGKEETAAALIKREPSLAAICGTDFDLFDAAGMALYGAASLRSGS